MRYFRFATTVTLLASAGLSLSAQTPAIVRPHHQGARPAGDLTSSFDRPPWETPTSLACIYRLVSTLVPGCPVNGTTAVPRGGNGIIAVVNAFDYPTAGVDLTVFSRQFGLPECNTSNPCFRKVYATGVAPPVDGLWSANASSIVEYAHAFAPNATIVLVEAASAGWGDLRVAVHVANQIIANSPLGRGQVILPFGSQESASDVNIDADFTTPGIVYLADSQGAPGFLEYPALSPNVIAVGGTGIFRDSQGNFVGEPASTFWTGGTSALWPRPAYQDGIQSIVGSKRGIPDVAFAADPLIGAVLYYDTTPLDVPPGWQFSGNTGTGLAGWAAIFNRLGSTAGSTAEALTMIYSDLGNASALRDVTRGQALGVHARTGWDFLTGVGVPVSLLGN